MTFCLIHLVSTVSSCRSVFSTLLHFALGLSYLTRLWSGSLRSVYQIHFHLWRLTRRLSIEMVTVDTDLTVGQPRLRADWRWPSLPSTSRTCIGCITDLTLDPKILSSLFGVSICKIIVTRAAVVRKLLGLWQSVK